MPQLRFGLHTGVLVEMSPLLFATLMVLLVAGRHVKDELGNASSFCFGNTGGLSSPDTDDQDQLTVFAYMQALWVLSLRG